MRIHFTHIGRVTMTFLAMIALFMLNTAAAHGSFQLDNDSLESDRSISTGSGFQLEAGLGTMRSIRTFDPSSSHSDESSSQSSNPTTTVADSSGGGRRNLPDPTPPPLHAAPTDNASPSRPAPALPAPALPAPALPATTQKSPKPTEALTTVSPSETVLAPHTAAKKPVIQETITAPAKTQTQEPLSSTANAVALGSISVTEVGILARLAWIARLKSLYGVIPAFLS